MMGDFRMRIDGRANPCLMASNFKKIMQESLFIMSLLFIYA